MDQEDRQKLMLALDKLSTSAGGMVNAAERIRRFTDTRSDLDLAAAITHHLGATKHLHEAITTIMRTMVLDAASKELLDRFEVDGVDGL